jgi:hypothetical protein
MSEYTSESMERILQETNVVELESLRLDLIRRKQVAGGLTDRTARSEAIRAIDGWLRLIKARIKAVGQSREVESTNRALSAFQDRIRRLLPGLTYSGPELVEWERLRADLEASASAADDGPRRRALAISKRESTR